MKFYRKCLVWKLGIAVALLLSIGWGLVPFPVHAAANDFTITSLEADYYLTRSERNQSQLKVAEKITAAFPEVDQNHGIERAIPNTYDGHSVNLRVLAVQDSGGVALPYATRQEHDHTVLRIGDPDRYVQGAQTYLISYELVDVTKNFRDQDEFFWDVNGTQWRQQFQQVTARLHLQGKIAHAYEDRYRCFTGHEGSRESACTVQVSGRNEDIVLTVQTNGPLGPGENLSIVSAFHAGTFAPYKLSLWERLLPWLIGIWLVLGGIALLVTIVILIRAWRKFGRSPEGQGTIVPQYLPPKQLSLLSAASILNKKGPAITAQVIDLAVRHYIKVYEMSTKNRWARRVRTFELEMIRLPYGLRPEEKQVIAMIFGDTAQIGARVALQSLSSRLSKSSLALHKDIEKTLRHDAYLADITGERRLYYWFGGLQLLFVNPGTLIGGLMTLIAVASWRPLTRKGVDMRDYLKGLEMYMKLAEAERLKLLQGPDNADRSGVHSADSKQLIKLYEHLLPYAIIFGMEKEWARQFAHLYAAPPEWYSGSGAFNAASFTAAVHGFVANSSTVLSPSGNSSSSGFSGGSSGGGGGGGGGGGW